MKPVQWGPLDTRLGTSSKSEECGTCGKGVVDCPGHFGYIALALPVFHAGYFKAALGVLQAICKHCCRILLGDDDVQTYWKKLANPSMDGMARAALLKAIHEKAKKVQKCPHCSHVNGAVKKAGLMRVIHEHKPIHSSEKRPSAKGDEDAKVDEKWKDVIETAPELKYHVTSKACREHLITPLDALRLFEGVSDLDATLLGMKPPRGRPERFLWTHVPVPPASIRPSVPLVAESGSNEDDLTTKLADIVYTSNIVGEALGKGVPLQMLMEDWDYLALQLALYLNSETALPPSMAASSIKGAPFRGIAQRLKGKMGRFRGNLSGKRVDFSARTVISPDPNLRPDQVGIPVLIAKTLTYPERVTAFNLGRLRQAVINGPAVHPGANFVTVWSNSSSSGGIEQKRYLKFGDRSKIARDLKPGDVVERHVIDGDIVLFNRQPSLHTLSIMAHFVVVHGHKTFRFNECSCTPYNADFDGDEMNVHVPQTEEARSEALHLMALAKNQVTPRNGNPLVACIQDFITAAFLCTGKDTFFTRDRMAQACCFPFDAKVKVHLPNPAILHPLQLWTGKQLFQVLLKPNSHLNCSDPKEYLVRQKTLDNALSPSHSFLTSIELLPSNNTTLYEPILVNVEGKCRTFNGKSRSVQQWGNVFCPADGYLLIRNSELLAGTLDKGNIGAEGKSGGLLYAILRDYGPMQAVSVMTRMSKFCSRWLGYCRGFSIGIEDVAGSQALRQLKEEVVKKGYGECEALLEQFREGKLPPQAGCTSEQTLEAKMSGTLSRIRDDVGQACLSELSRNNPALVMQWCGSKGSKINVSQMAGCVGQQIVAGQRIPDGFPDGRSLPHFPKHDRSPAAKGFVQNSFFSGLSPTEFFFHAVSGREGLVDTAVKTAETGYMQRRLMKALEDLSVAYDGSVRTATGGAGIVQWRYGDDGLNPACMETDDALPVAFERNLNHALSVLDYFTPPQKNEFNDEMNVKRDEKDVGLLLEKDAVMGMVRESLPDAHDRFLVALESYLASKLDTGLKLTYNQLDAFLALCSKKYHGALMEPGTAVGALSAQSIGEPGTQMTLKTFHFAGVAAMNVTLGVPRIKEIINASKLISTPIITAPLVNSHSLPSAKIVRSRLERTVLGDILVSMEELWLVDPQSSETKQALLVKLNWQLIAGRGLELTTEGIKRAILKAPKLKLNDGHSVIATDDSVTIYLPVTSLSSKETTSSSAASNFRMQFLRRALPNVYVCGIPSVSRAVINDCGNSTYNLLLEGYGLRDVMSQEGVIGTHCLTNHVLEVAQVCGIEAGRASIIHEITDCMAKHGMTIDTRHVMLLADCMTYRGEVLGITRFGVARMKDSVLLLASFERTMDHLFDAGRYCKTDGLEGVSERIIMGVPMSIGTGSMKVLQRLPEDQLGPQPLRPLMFAS